MRFKIWERLQNRTRHVGVANLATRWHEVPSAPPLGELLSKARLRGCSALNGMVLRFCTALVGVANLATRRRQSRRIWKTPTIIHDRSVAGGGGSPSWRPLQTQKFLASTIQQGAL